MVFIVECADGTLHGEMCKTRELEKKLQRIHARVEPYFKANPHKLPVKVVFQQREMHFREAHAKKRYFLHMNRKQKIKLIEQGFWPIGGSIKEFIISRDPT